VAQDPRSHPHGGGEGKSSIGMNPKTPWGRPAMGKITRTRKKSFQSFNCSKKKKVKSYF